MEHQNTDFESHDPRERQRELDVLQTVISALSDLSPDSQKRILESAITFLNIDIYVKQPAGRMQSPTSGQTSQHADFSDDRAMSPKEFLLEKQPQTDVERMACLAYYLTHYRDTPHFKTLELSKLNTESAQPKFSNATYTANNALKRGYLAPGTKGHKQLSAAGERFVQALPNRSEAKAAMAAVRPRRAKRKTSKRKTKKSGQKG